MNDLPLWLQVALSWRLEPFGLAAGGLALLGAAHADRLGCRGTSRPLLAAAAVLLLAGCSPLGSYADGVLFSAHMLRHLLLMLVVPLLLARAAAAWSTPAPPRPAGPGRLAAGSVGTLLAMWVWHQPTLCSLSFTHPAAGLARDLCFLGAGWAFWRPLVGRGAVAGPAAVAWLFASCVGCTALGAYITFNPLSVCPVFLDAGRVAEVRGLARSGWSPQRDQQLAGLLMWVLPCVGYVLASMATLHRWYTQTLSTPTRAARAVLP